MHTGTLPVTAAASPVEDNIERATRAASGSGPTPAFMFEDRNYNRTFYSAPQTVTSLVATMLEPSITLATLLFAMFYVGAPIDQAVLILCVGVFIGTFPGRNRFGDNLIAAGVGIATSWVAVCVIVLMLIKATLSTDYFRKDALLLWALITPVLHLAAVWVGKSIVQRLSARPSNRRTAVVVGAGKLGVKVAKALVESGGHGIDFVGYFDDRTDDRVHHDATLHRLGGLKDVAKYALERGVREVYITLPLGSQPRIVELLEELQGTTASLFFVPDVFGIHIIQGRLHDMHGVPVVGICETPFTGTNELTKRITDIVLALIILILISPLLLVLAVGVKLSSPGPVIFKQRRNGLDGDEIIVYKFRSMSAQDNGPVVRQATKDDPRITRFGAFIRRTSLDELPQFINVLQGRMSIVGPRPHAVAHNEQYRQMIKAYMVRHKVKPGITGWAQVNGHRGETDTLEKMAARVDYDLYYLRNWSLALDLQIIVRTIRVLFFDRHAY